MILVLALLLLAGCIGSAAAQIAVDGGPDLCTTPDYGAPGCVTVTSVANPCGLEPIEGGLVCCCTEGD